MDDDDDWDDAFLSTIDALETSHLQQRQAGGGAHAALHAAQPQEWACRSCTLVNGADMTACSMCNTARGQVYQPQQAILHHIHATSTSAQPTTSSFFNPVPSQATTASSQSRKTVQATLPFAKPPSSVPTAPTSRRIEGHGAANTSSRPPTAPTSSTQNGRLAFPPRTGMAHAQSDAIDGDDDETDPAAALALLAKLKHKGEDNQARMRYYTDAELGASRQSLHPPPPIDYDTAGSFIYPTNYSVREYQLTIAEKALYHNTLVSLPTGLGKTLIASVVMYNFYRWFPDGQIVFMAPTKPLVAQQIGACHEIMGIPLSDTAELQGSVPPTTRKVLWNTKRVFFCTPQSMHNDLQRGICRAERLVCLVVDEAHRATGNYAYCGVIHEVEKRTKQFRVLALSATPGSKFEVIQEVIRNLRITHIESRSADDPDVKKYTHARQEEVIKCSLSGQISEAKALLMQVFQRIVQRLFIGNIIQHKDPERLTKWYVLQMREKFRLSPNYQTNRSAESDLALLVSLLHARDLLTGHGLSSFKECIEDFVTEQQRSGSRPSWSKKELLQSTEFQALRLSLQTVSNENELTNPSSHPKLLKLRDVLHEHFQRHAMGKSSTRAIVFTQYRSSVTEIVKLLTPLAPLILAQQFVGQGASGKSKESKGQSQKEQQEIVRKFRAGQFNVLVATCIAEEGLDIGEVDLIVSFDALSSPVRMIQRMGRTGRKRVGKVIILVTEGDEEKKLARGVSAAKTVSRALTTFKSKFVYGKCPRMLPPGCVPTLATLEMVIPEFHASQVAGKQQLGLRASSRNDGEGAPEKRDMSWKLNDLERSIARTRYVPSTQWPDAPRHEFLPIAPNRTMLLRRRCPDDGRTSSRSLGLLKLVRKINGVHYEDEELEQRAPPIVVRDRPSLSLGLYDDSNEVLAFSDPEDLHDDHMHFSPQYSGVPALPPEPVTPARVSGAQQQTPRTIEPDQRTPFIGELVNSATKAVGGGAQVSPLRQVTMTGKPSPSPGRKPSPSPGRKKSLGSGTKKTKKRTERPRDAIDESLLERGDRLLQQLQAMVMSEDAASSTEVSSPEPEPQAIDEEPMMVEMPLQFPRIARRLEFERHGIDIDPDSSTGETRAPRPNCVPLPPTEQELFSLLSTKVAPVVAVEVRQGTEHGSTPRLPVESSSKLSPEKANVTATAVDSGRSAAIAVQQPQTHCVDASSSCASSPAVETTKAPFSSVRTPLQTEKHGVVPRPQLFQMKKPKRSLALRDIPQSMDDDDFEDEPRKQAPKPQTTSTVTSSATARQEKIQSTKSKADVALSRIAARGSKSNSSTGKTTIIDLIASSHALSKERDVSSRFEVPKQQESSRVETQTQTQTQDEPCSICCENESFDDDPIVFCGGCNTAVHQFCYGIPVLPKEDWYCDLCLTTRPHGKGNGKAKAKTPGCALCPMRSTVSGGAMKQSQCGQWVHVQCFLWIPELQFHFDSNKLRLGTIDRLDPDRKTLHCALCNSKRGGGVIQCVHKRCLTAFHVSCASAALSDGYKLVQLDQDEGEDSKTLFVAYCQLHNKSKSLWRTPQTAQTAASPANKQALSSAASPFAKAPPSARSPLSALSPSALLMSQADSAKKQRKQFRRLKRKYDVAMPSQANGTQQTPPMAHSPWTKRMKRSEKSAQGRREYAKAIAKMFIEDEVDAPGSGDDEDEDDEMDEEDAAFINDSSQLIYSPSVPTPVRKKKSKRNSLGDMRAIYARSLIESPQLRRGRHMLPSNGIIGACLQEMNEESVESMSASADESEQASQVGHGNEDAEVIEIMDESEPQPGEEDASMDTINEQAETRDEGAVPLAPCFDLLGLATATMPPLSAPTAREVQREMKAAQVITADDEAEQKRSLREKIEANRLKALRLLEEKKQAARTSESVFVAEPTSKPMPTEQQQSEQAHRKASIHKDSVVQVQTPAPLVPAARSSFEAAPPSFNLLGMAAPMSPPSSIPTMSVIVQSVARSSPVLKRLQSDSESLDFQDEAELEADAMLSLRVAVLNVDLRSSETPSLHDQQPRIDITKGVFKQFVVAVLTRDSSTAQELSRSPHVQELRALPNCRSVIITNDPKIVCKALLTVARDENNLGFGFPSEKLAAPVSTSGVDSNFHARLQFFRSTRVLPLGSALSLSFRFDKFTIQQIPVKKFNEMHWRRMLPWISEHTAKQLYGYFLNAAK